MLNCIDIGSLARKTPPGLVIGVMLGAIFYLAAVIKQPSWVPAPASVVLQQYLVMAITSNNTRSVLAAQDARGSTYFSIDKCGPDGACSVTLTLPKAVLADSMETGTITVATQRHGDTPVDFADVAVRFELSAAPFGRFNRGTVPEDFAGLLASAAGGEILGVRAVEPSHFGDADWRLRDQFSGTAPFAVMSIFAIVVLLVAGPALIHGAVLALVALLLRAFFMGVLFAPWF